MSVKKKSNPILPFMTGLSLGLVVAAIIYFEEHNNIVDNLFLSKEEKTITKKQASSPKPKFDFYKILPEKKVNISEWESVEEKESTSDNKSSIYILQIGSFKKFKAADSVKAKLALMGISADIQRVVINGQDVRHRVRVGPYKDSSQLKKAKKLLSANNLSFMTLKLKIEDN